MDKKIKILTSGPIRAKGLIYGPVLTPYMETEDNIFTLLAAGVKVVEVLPDKTEVELTLSNFRADNSVKPVPTVEPVVEPEPVQEPVVEEAPVEETVEVTVETPVEEPAEDVNVTIEPKAEKFVPEKQNDYKNKKQHGKQFAKDNK